MSYGYDTYGSSLPTNDWWKLFGGGSGGGSNGYSGTDIAKLLMAGGSLAGKQAPTAPILMPTGMQWNTYSGDLGPGTANIANFLKGSGINNMQDLYNNMTSQYAPQLLSLARDSTKNYKDLLGQQVRQNVNPAMETIAANMSQYGGGFGSGAMGELMASAGTKMGLDAMLAGEGATQNLFGNWTNSMFQTVPSMYTSLMGQYSNSDVAPVAMPTYDQSVIDAYNKQLQGQDQGNWLQNLLSGAGGGAALGTAIPGLGTAIGAGIGGLAGLLSTWF